jgi:hypothetical protein
MSEIIEFESFAAVESLLRAGMELKFELSDDDALLNGSPVYAGALSSLREGLIEGLKSSALAGKAQTSSDWYLLSRHPQHWGVIARRSVLHPRWQNLSLADARRWIETLAAPLVVDDEGFASVRSAADTIIENS